MVFLAKDVFKIYLVLEPTVIILISLSSVGRYDISKLRILVHMFM